jgi:hypothetical protein
MKESKGRRREKKEKKFSLSHLLPSLSLSNFLPRGERIGERREGRV